MDQRARFALILDGTRAGTSAELWISQSSPRTAAGAGRQVLAHELTHIVQQQNQGGGSCGGPLTLTLKQVTLSQSAWAALQVGGLASRRLGIGTATGPVAGWLRAPRILHPAGPAQAKGTDVAMEELVLAVEGLDR